MRSEKRVFIDFFDDVFNNFPNFCNHKKFPGFFLWILKKIRSKIIGSVFNLPFGAPWQPDDDLQLLHHISN
jgi:hypothetical protein